MYIIIVIYNHYVWSSISLNTSHQIQKQKSSGFPSWFSDKESSCQCRRHRFHAWSGKIPHAPKLLSHVPQPLSLCCRAREPQLLKPRHPKASSLQYEKPPQWTASTLQWRIAPAHTKQRSPGESKEDPAQANKSTKQGRKFQRSKSQLHS